MHTIPFIAAVISFFAVIGVTAWGVSKLIASDISSAAFFGAMVTLFCAGSFGAVACAGVSYAFFSTVVS
jgi:hypothetical protein